MSEHEQDAPLTGSEKHALRGRAQVLKPQLLVGKAGVTPDVLKEAEQVFAKTDLMKVRFSASREILREQCRQIAEGTQSTWLGQVGRTASFYRRRKTEEGVIDEIDEG